MTKANIKVLHEGKAFKAKDSGAWIRPVTVLIVIGSFETLRTYYIPAPREPGGR